VVDTAGESATGGLADGSEVGVSGIAFNPKEAAGATDCSFENVIDD
jgi:hypothetical protein